MSRSSQDHFFKIKMKEVLKMKIHAYQIFEIRDRKHIPLLGIMCTATELIEIMEEIKKDNPLMRIDFKRVEGIADSERR